MFHPHVQHTEIQTLTKMMSKKRETSLRPLNTQCLVFNIKDIFSSGMFDIISLIQYFLVYDFFFLTSKILIPERKL